MTKRKPPGEHKKMGAPTKCTKQVVDQIASAMKLGASVEQAAAYAGITRATLYNWLNSSSTHYRALQREVEVAKGGRAVGWLHALQLKASSTDRDAWKAAAWLLERTLPDQFGPKGQVALSRGADAHPNVAELEAAAARGVSLADGAVLWQRQLTVLEGAYARGELDATTYLDSMAKLSAQAARLVELKRHAEVGGQLPQVQLAFTMDNPGILDAAPLPDGLKLPGRAAGGGDLIDAG